MRLFSMVVVAAAFSLTAALPATAQKSDDDIVPRALTLSAQGKDLLAAGKLVQADEAFEASLAVDPRNRAAYVGLARVAMGQKRFGAAYKFSTKALSFEPTDRDALALQGAALVELGAKARAEASLEKLRKACGGSCPEIASLQAAITRGPSPVPAKPTETKTN